MSFLAFLALFHNTYADESCTQGRFRQTLWFSFTKGYVSHPFSVGQCRNMEADYLQLNDCSWGGGSSGAPILNTNGEVIGIYEACSLNSDCTRAASWATRATSVADYFVKLLKKEAAEELSLMRILMQYRAETKSKKEIKLSRKCEPERRGRKGKQKRRRQIKIGRTGLMNNYSKIQPCI